MKIIIFKLNLIIFLIFSFNFFSYSQDSRSNYFINHFDSLYGADNLIVNGRLYLFPNYKAKGTPFLYDDKINYSTIYINNREYLKKPVLYNIEKDKLIILKKINNNKFFIEMNNTLIDSFIIYSEEIKKNSFDIQNINFTVIGNGNYKNLEFSKKFVNNDSLGFCELIYSNKYILLKKYIKEFSYQISSEYPYGRYSDEKETLFLIYDNKIINIDNKKKLLNIFHSKKKEIRTFIKKNKIKYKKVKNVDLIKLIRFCEILEFNNNEK